MVRTEEKGPEGISAELTDPEEKWPRGASTEKSIQMKRRRPQWIVSRKERLGAYICCGWLGWDSRAPAKV
jgi:hypothetical protein